MEALKQSKLAWQSKTVLLVVLPFAAADLVLETHWWATQSAPVAIWTIGLSFACAGGPEAARRHPRGSHRWRRHHRQPHVFDRYLPL